MLFGGLRAPSVEYIIRINQFLKQGRRVVFFNSNRTWGKGYIRTLVEANKRDKYGISKYYLPRIEEALQVYKKEFKKSKRMLIACHSQGCIHGTGLALKLLDKNEKIKINIIQEAPAGIDEQDVLDVSHLMGRAMNSYVQEWAYLPLKERYLFRAKKKLRRKERIKDSLKSAGAVADTDMTPGIKRISDSKNMYIRIILPTSDRLIKSKKTKKALERGGVNTNKLLKVYPCNKYGHNAISYDQSSTVLNMVQELENLN